MNWLWGVFAAAVGGLAVFTWSRTQPQRAPAPEPAAPAPITRPQPQTDTLVGSLPTPKPAIVELKRPVRTPRLERE